MEHKDKSEGTCIAVAIFIEILAGESVLIGDDDLQRVVGVDKSITIIQVTARLFSHLN